jgi:transcriptional regulator with XRE-family HTH domain
MPMTKTYEEVLEEALKDPRVKREYDALEPEFQLQRALMLLRRERGMSQQDVAERLGIQQEYISRIERGHVGVSFSYLVKLADAMDADLEISFRLRDRQGKAIKCSTSSSEQGHGTGEIYGSDVDFNNVLVDRYEVRKLKEKVVVYEEAEEINYGHMPQDLPVKFISVAEAARELDIPTHTIGSWVANSYLQNVGKVS